MTDEFSNTHIDEENLYEKDVENVGKHHILFEIHRTI